MSESLGPVDYAGEPPRSYCCAKCRAFGVKLWRQYQTMADYIELLCADCACKSRESTKNLVVGDDGKHESPTTGLRSDQIGWLVPAVPTEDGETFWGYSSVPQEGVDWWKRMPTRKKAEDGAVQGL